MKQKELERLVKQYSSEGMLNHPDVVLDMHRKSKKMNDEIPGSELQRNLNHYKVLPLFGQLQIFEHSIQHGTVSAEDRTRLEKLENLYQKLHFQKPYNQIIASDLENRHKKLLRFDPSKHSNDFLKYLLIQNGACYADKRKLDEIVSNFFIDTILATSHICAVTKSSMGFPEGEEMRKIQSKQKHNNPVMAVGKYMVCVDKKNDLALAIDHYSFGDYHSRHIDDWVNANKISDFAYGPAAAMFLAKKLDISKIIYCDLETEEFASKCGVKRQTVFNRTEKTSKKNDGRKAGIIAVPDNSVGVWTHAHSIFNNRDGRNITLDYEPLSIDKLESRFKGIYNETYDNVSRNKRLDHKQIAKMRILERFSAMTTILRIAEDSYLTHKSFRSMKNQYNTLIDTIRTKNFNFYLPYAK